jgi:hypothetical protein
MTETYNPILGKETVPIWHFLSLHLRPAQNQAHVFFQRGKSPITLRPDDGQAARQVRWGSYEVRYAVDTSEHFVGFDCKLPSDNDVLEFQADVQLTCRVHDPVIVVKRNMTDASAALKPSLVRVMSQASRECDGTIKQRSNAEGAVSRAVMKRQFLVGFEITSFALRLSLAEEEQNHLRSLRQIERDMEREIKEAVLWRLRDKNEITRRGTSINFFNELYEKGYGHLLMLYLAQHPEQIREVAQLLVHVRRDEQKHWLQALEKLQAADVLEEHHLQELRNFIFQQLNERKQQDMMLEKLDEAKANGQNLS